MSDLVVRWDAALAQVRAHEPRCRCDACVTARSFLERMKQLLIDLRSGGRTA